MSRASRPARIAVVAAAALALVAGIGWWSRPAAVPEVAALVPPATAPAPAAAEPYAQTMAVLTRGGSAGEEAAAIEFLDTVTRFDQALSEPRRAAMLAALDHGSPPGMTTGSWAQLFHSACNALAAGGTAPAPEFIALLEHLATHDSRQVIRLYALQHLGNRYAACDAATRERLRALVSGMLAERPVSPVAGTALVLARSWETSGPPAAVAGCETARMLAADATLPVDVRVTALHTAGEDAAVLETARALAADLAQPVILRKAALCLIGRHGTAEDFPLLRRCSAASPRLAQASDPAARALKARLDGRPQPQLQPY